MKFLIRGVVINISNGAMDFFLISQKIKKAVEQATNILLVIHQRPDADALGSLAAFTEWLDSLGKQYVSFCSELSASGSETSFLPGPIILLTEPKSILSQTYDLIVVFDSGDLKYAGVQDILPQLSPVPLLINIDHHATNINFGDINLVDDTAASTTEILYRFFHYLKINISPAAATALLAGIIYDTYSFTNPNTKYHSLEIASQLLSAGAKLPQITDSILKNKTPSVLKIWGKILYRLSHNSEFDIVTTVVTTQDLGADNQEAELTDGIANFLNNLSDIKAILILQQQKDGFIKGSLRTNNDLIDVSKLAKILGGGGHRKAAGFKIKGTVKRLANSEWQIV